MVPTCNKMIELWTTVGRGSLARMLCDDLTPELDLRHSCNTPQHWRRKGWPAVVIKYIHRTREVLVGCSEEGRATSIQRHGKTRRIAGIGMGRRDRETTGLADIFSKPLISKLGAIATGHPTDVISKIFVGNANISLEKRRTFRTSLS